MSHFGKIFFVGGRGGILAMGGGNFSGVKDHPDIWQPAADLMEVEGGFLVHVDLPGIDPASVEAVIDSQRLIIRGIRPAICPSRCKKYVHMEISRGEFGKIIMLPKAVSEDKCQASLRDGVLEIFLPFGPRAMFSVTTLRIKTVIQR